jgi:hypothetical protein
MLNWHRLAAITVSVGIGAVVAVHAQQQRAATASAGKASTLMPMDYVEIRQLVSRYAFAWDTAADNGCEFADLFASDGESVRPNAKGRDQLAAAARSQNGQAGPANTSRYLMNHVIEPSPDGAIGREYMIVINHDSGTPQAAGRGRSGQPAPPVDQWALVGQKRGELEKIGGHFEDVYVKTPLGWRFKRREFIPAASGARPAVPEPMSAAQATPAAPPCGAPKPWPKGALTAMDYLEIGQLVASYGNALDSGYGTGDNGEAYANLYTPDATFGRSAGHDALAALARVQPLGPKYVRHFLTNHVIEPTPEGARGKQYLVVIDISEKGEPGSIFLGGHYEDTYAKTPDGWRFKTRTLIRAQSGKQPAQSPRS